MNGRDDDDLPPGFEPQAQSSSMGHNSAHQQEEDYMDRRGPGRLVDTKEEIRAEPAGNTPYTSAVSFEELNLSKELLEGLYSEMKYEKPSRIQATTLPMILTPPYRHLIAQAHNGSGKTTCFVLAMLSRVDLNLNEPQAICVCPTRELVVQNLMVLRRMGKFTKITSTSTATQEFELTRGAKIPEHIVIGTHGKLKNWVAKRILPTKHFKVLVFDEADEMLKANGFASDSIRMINTLKDPNVGNPQLQILLFSATFSETVKGFAEKVVVGANKVFVSKEDLSLDVIKQYRVYCPTRDDKTWMLKNMIFPNCEKLGQTIIFVKTRHTARTLHEEMEKDGHKCTSIHGDLTMEARDRVVREFRDGTTKVLIATDVLARGFDVTQVTLVVNYDPPVERETNQPDYETYLHRIGRSGRFGRKGAAFNLVLGSKDRDSPEKTIYDQIETYFNHSIPAVPFNDEAHFVEVLKEADLTDG